MVGFFGPLVEPLKKRCKALHIFERMPDHGQGVLPEEAQAEVLPRCQIAIVTATSVLNRILDNLLGYCRNAREVMLLGPHRSRACQRESSRLWPQAPPARTVSISDDAILSDTFPVVERRRTHSE